MSLFTLRHAPMGVSGFRMNAEYMACYNAGFRRRPAGKEQLFRGAGDSVRGSFDLRPVRS